jgi:Trypsin
LAAAWIGSFVYVQILLLCGGHPEVGALLAPQPYPDGTWETCSGTLISPTVFLTAAHCDQGVSRVAVTFDSSYNATTGTNETNIVAGTTITGDFMCRATNVDYRMDTALARAFLGQYVTLP